VRAPVVFYNRANEAAALLKPGDVDWRAIFDGGVRWFHSGGIFAALSETTGQLIIEGMQAAHEAGAVTSFDLNFRAKLWNVWGNERKAAEVIDRILEHVDVLIGIPGQDLAANGDLTPTTCFAMIEQVASKHPSVKAVATTLREVHSTNRHSWAAVAWLQGQSYESPSCQLDVLDRVGSGDGFAAGFIYGLLAGKDPQEAVNLGWAHGALLTTYPGDTTMATLPEIVAFAQGGSARIQR
jgi:2-dehydro-3-deoxygluconokinase